MTVRGSGTKRIGIETASQLLDFRGGSSTTITPHVADEQLRGAVALHNILQDERFAYLADEVGMGKTYVALGALALFRHFDPTFRVLVIAPRENIQKKWVKELGNFTANNVRFADLRVKAVHGAPARATIMCSSLLELVRETSVDPDRDFFARLTSFSLPLGKDSEGWKTKRDQMRRHLPWLDASLFDLRSRSSFKDNFARAANCGLPVFDLVIFDEGHNIKGGYRLDAASRNRVLALAMGRAGGDDVDARSFPEYGARARRVLFLSATPLENDYVQLWNQLDVFGFGDSVRTLIDPKATDDEKRDCARRFLIRRVTSLPVGERKLTKNLYRREWRKGGVDLHDDALAVPDERQRLTVALVQKKVTEVLGGAKFNNSFQIGMLASFESFLETSRVRERGTSDVDPSNFDDTDQTENADERLGIDVESVNGLARNYRRRFGAELPHPKMDGVARQLASAFETGDKSLVFVRRVASVKELQRKLEEHYNQYLLTRLRRELSPVLLPALERIIVDYQAARLAGTPRSPVVDVDLPMLDDETVVEPEIVDDAGGNESFFAWFLRGRGPGGQVLSGAILQRRFSQKSGVYSTFFEENHVAWLLGVRPGEEPRSVARALADYLGMPLSRMGTELARLAAPYLPVVKKQSRGALFRAFQAAAVSMLASCDGPLRERARIVQEESYLDGELTSRHPPDAPGADDWLEIRTFWTELRARPALCESLWPASAGAADDLRCAYRTRELRRELLSAMTRLGHPFIDLYLLSVNRIGSLELGARDQSDEGSIDLVSAFLDLLERQAVAPARGYTAYKELREAAANFELIVTVNEPKARTAPLASAATAFGRLLRSQQPVGGMFGQINETLVRQFRMPGYPCVLVTTDLLQEGEDLHTFCSSVYHYGISWMPSSMEQRVGRVDRVSSQTDRRLTRAGADSGGDELLQVYYPHLRDTIEVLQVDRVLERINRFVRLMHENLGGAEAEERTLDMSKEMLRERRDTRQLSEPLMTAFPVRDEFVQAPDRPLAVTPDTAADLRARFAALPHSVCDEGLVTWEDCINENALLGTIPLRTRSQPFTLILRSTHGLPTVRCVSPVGQVDLDLEGEEIAGAVRGTGVRIGAEYDERMSSYNLTIEGDVVLGDRRHDAERVKWLLQQVTAVADHLEEAVLEKDQPMAAFRDDLAGEASYAR